MAKRTVEVLVKIKLTVDIDYEEGEDDWWALQLKSKEALEVYKELKGYEDLEEKVTFKLLKNGRD